MDLAKSGSILNRRCDALKNIDGSNLATSGVAFVAKGANQQKKPDTTNHFHHALYRQRLSTDKAVIINQLGYLCSHASLRAFLAVPALLGTFR